MTVADPARQRPTRSRLGFARFGAISADVTDEALLGAMAMLDERAGAFFVRRHQRRVFGIALAVVGDRSIAEEVAQEAFLRAWRHAAIFDARRASALTWMATITRNLAIDALRLRRSIPTDPDDLVWREIESDDHPVEAHAVHADELARVREVLELLPEDQRRALVRAAMLGQSASEISAFERIPLGTAKSRVRIALAKVRDALAIEDA